jgi:hypothetical protein
MRSIKNLSIAWIAHRGCALSRAECYGPVSSGTKNRKKKRSNIMNHFTSKPEITLTSARKATLRHRPSRAALAFLGLLTLVCTATLTAKAAGCGGLRGGDNVVKYPMIEQHGATGPDTIVGLWHVTYTTSSNAPFAVSLKQWHSDGTEFEDLDRGVVGNFCVGVWKQIGPRTFRLHHTGWTFDDNGNSTGSFIINETDTVAPNGMSYTGNFDFKVYDTSGDYISGTETTGTIAASRITVN